MTQPDAETKALMNSIFIDKVLRARRRLIGDKMLDGPRLFDDCNQMMRGGIRSQFPMYNDEQVEQELRRRLAIQRQIHERGIYQDAGVLDE